MDYTVFCDESRHTGAPGDRFQVLGSIWMPTELKADLTRDLKALRRQVGLNGEIKWTKVSTAKLDSYRALGDFFFSKHEVKFRSIVVDQRAADYATFHDGDRELGFYRFYYEMIEKWLQPSNRYTILLDFKNNKGADRYGKLRECLYSYGRGRNIQIKDLTVIDSHSSHLAQLCDLLTGAVSTDVNSLATGSAKVALIEHLRAVRGTQKLSTPSRSPAISKFNVFHINFAASKK